MGPEGQTRKLEWSKGDPEQGAGGDNTNNGGTMYIVGPNGCCSLTLWTITNTQLLNNGQAPNFPAGRVIGVQQLNDPPQQSTMVRKHVPT
jgi:hypothetical protein